MKQKLTEGERKQTLFFFLRELGFRLVSVQELSKGTQSCLEPQFFTNVDRVSWVRSHFLCRRRYVIRLDFVLGDSCFFLLLNKVCKIQVFFSNMSQLNSNPLSVNLGGKIDLVFLYFSFRNVSLVGFFLDSQIRNLDRLDVAAAAAVRRRRDVGRRRDGARPLVRVPHLVDDGGGDHVTAVVGQRTAEDLHRVVGRRRRRRRRRWLVLLQGVVVTVRRSVHVDRRALLVAVIDDVIVVPAHTNLGKIRYPE